MQSFINSFYNPPYVLDYNRSRSFLNLPHILFILKEKIDNLIFLHSKPIFHVQDFQAYLLMDYLEETRYYGNLNYAEGW